MQFLFTTENIYFKYLLHNIGIQILYNFISDENFDYNTFKGGLPYVYVYDHKHWKSIKKKIHPNNVKQFIDELDELITDNKIDVMVFDFLENKVCYII